MRGPAWASEVRSDARKTWGRSRASSGTSAEVGELRANPVVVHQLEEAAAVQRGVDLQLAAASPCPRRSRPAGARRKRGLCRTSRAESSALAGIGDQLHGEPRARAVAERGADARRHDLPRAGDQVRAALIDALRQARAVGGVEHAAEHRQQQDREPGLQRAEARAAEAVVRAARRVRAAVALGADQERRGDRSRPGTRSRRSPSRVSAAAPRCEKPVSAATARPKCVAARKAET